jgi:hypothetical protein
MSSLDSATLQYLDGVVRATVQERKKYPTVSQIIDRIVQRCPLLTRESLEKHKEIINKFWVAHTNALDDTEAPPSPPDSAKNGGHRGSNGLSSVEGSGTEDRVIIPAEDPEVTKDLVPFKLFGAVLTIRRRLNPSLFQYTSRS